MMDIIFLNILHIIVCLVGNWCKRCFGEVYIFMPVWLVGWTNK